jgi:hypothetical protein
MLHNTGNMAKIEETIKEAIKEKCENKCGTDSGCCGGKKWKKSGGAGGGGGAVYFFGFVGALIYLFQHGVTTFGSGVVAFLKAIVWPAFLVYKLLEFLKF